MPSVAEIVTVYGLLVSSLLPMVPEISPVLELIAQAAGQTADAVGHSAARPVEAGKLQRHHVVVAVRLIAGSE